MKSIFGENELRKIDEKKLPFKVPDTVADSEAHMTFQHEDKIKREPLHEALLQPEKRISND